MSDRLSRLAIILVLALLIIAGTMSTPPSLQAGNGQPPVAFVLVPPTRSIQPGDIFTVDIRLDIPENSHIISFMKFILRIDSSRIEATAFQPNRTAFPQLGIFEQTPLGSGVNRIGILVGIGANPVDGITSSGIVATITFHAVGPADSATMIQWDDYYALSLSSNDDASENVAGPPDDLTLCIGTCVQTPDPTSTPEATVTATLTPTFTPTSTVTPSSTITPTRSPTQASSSTRYYVFTPLIVSQ